MELGETVGISNGPLLGTMLDDIDGAVDGIPRGLDDRSLIGLLLCSRLKDGTELGMEPVARIGISAGPML